MSTAATRRVAVLTLVGALAVSCYLLARSLALAAGTAGDGDVCSALFERGCDDTLRDPFSRFGGIPLAGWGVVHFTTLLVLLLVGRAIGEGFAAATSAAAALLGIAGAVASAALIASIVAGAVPLCPLCLVANGLNLAAVVPLVRWSGRPFGEIAGDWRRAGRFLLGERRSAAPSFRWYGIGFACVALSALVTWQWILIEWDRARVRGREPDPEAILAAFAAAPVVEVSADPEAPALGPKSAPSVLVVFSDAYCPACRSLWSALPRILAKYGDGVRAEFRHFPLDPPCNSAAKNAVHPQACNAGLALEAALAQQRFWPLLEALVPPDPRERKDPFLDAAKAAGLDLDRFRSEFGSAKHRERLERDVALGTKLGVTATPAVFLNGRRVANPSPQSVGIVLAHAAGRHE